MGQITTVITVITTVITVITAITVITGVAWRLCRPAAERGTAALRGWRGEEGGMKEKERGRGMVKGTESARERSPLRQRAEAISSIFGRTW